MLKYFAAFCVLINPREDMHANACTHTHVRNCVCTFACKQTQTHADTSVCARMYARSIVYTRTQFAQTNGLTTCTRVYIINASNAMPKPYLYTYVRAYACTHVVDREQYSQTNGNARTQTHRCVRRVGNFCVQTCLRFAR